MTPNEIDVLLHYHTSPEAHPRASAPAVKHAIATLLSWGLLTTERAGDVRFYCTTSKGRAHVKQLCDLKTPIEKRMWIGADDKVIEGI